MATTLLDLAVKVSSQGVGDVERDLKRVESTGAQAEKNLAGSLKNIGGALQSAGKQMSTFVTLPLAGVGAGLVKLAGDAEAASTRMSVNFGKATGNMMDFLNTLQKSTPASMTELKNAASGAQGSLTTLGVETGKANKMTKEALEVASNLSAHMDIPMTEALDAVQAGYAGNTDSLRNMAYNMNQAMIDEEALRLGLIKEGEAADGAARAQAVHSLVLKQSEGIMDAAARQSETFNFQMRALWASIKDTGAEIGANLLPILTPLAEKLAGLVRHVGNLSPGMQAVILAVGAFAAAIGPLLVVVGTLFTVMAPLVGAISGAGGLAAALGIAGTAVGGFVVAAAPFLIVAAAIGAAAFLIYRNWGRIAPVLQAIGNTIRSALAPALRFLQSQVKIVTDFWNRNQKLMGQTTSAVWNRIKAIVTGVVRFLWNNLIRPIVSAIVNFWKQNHTQIVNILKTAWNSVKTIARTALRVLLQLIKLGMQLITGDWKGAWQTVRRILQIVWDAIKQLVKNALNILKNIIQVGWNVIRGIFVSFARWARRHWEQFWSDVRKLWENTTRKIRQWVSGWRDNLISIWNNLRDAAKNIFEAVGRFISDPIGAAVERVRGFMNAIIGIVAGVLRAFGQDSLAGKLENAISAKGSGAESKGRNARQGGPVYGLAKGGVMRNGGIAGGPTVLYGEAGPEAYVRLDKRTPESQEAARMIMRSPNAPKEYVPPRGLCGAPVPFARMAMGGVGADEMVRQVEKRWPGVVSTNQHALYMPADVAARSADFFVTSPGGYAEGSDKQMGDEIASFISPPSTEYAIWYGMANFGSGWSSNFNPIGIGNANTLGHYDHVHGTAHSGVFKGGQGGFGGPSLADRIWTGAGGGPPKDWRGAIGSAVLNAAAAIPGLNLLVGGARAAAKAYPGLEKLLPDKVGTLGGLGTFAQGLAGFLNDSYKGWIKDWIYEQFGSIGTEGSNAGTVKDWIKRGLEIGAAFPPTSANIDTMYGRAMQESGGDPNAVNDWDVNAAAGTPSKGLFQIIEPTWESERNTYGSSIGPFDANWNKGDLSAAIASRYMKTRYGSIVGSNGVGYSEGGIAIGKQLMTLAEEGKRELVIPLGSRIAQQAIHSAFAGNIERELAGMRADLRDVGIKLRDIDQPAAERVGQIAREGADGWGNSRRGRSVIRTQNESSQNNVSLSNGRRA